MKPLGGTADSSMLEQAPYDDIIPFLSEHVQPSDQILFVGASTDLALRLSLDNYGAKATGFMVVVDSDVTKVDAMLAQISTSPDLQKRVKSGKLTVETVPDLGEMGHICKQSTFDAIIDFGGLDTVLDESARALRCIDHLQNAVRLGNILVSISKKEKETYDSVFSERFGWVQELDGDPGEISAWYRGKTNIQASQSNFKKLGLKMYVYTNTDNC
jgi:hypothetical protein